jgi:hypothetical protein
MKLICFLLLATNSLLFAQTIDQLAQAGRDLETATDDLNRFDKFIDPEQKMDLATVTLVLSSHEIAVTLLTNHRRENPERFTDDFLRNCKHVSFQTMKVIFYVGAMKESFKGNDELLEAVGQANKKCLAVHELLREAVREFERRGLELTPR